MQLGVCKAALQAGVATQQVNKNEATGLLQPYAGPGLRPASPRGCRRLPARAGSAKYAW